MPRILHIILVLIYCHFTMAGFAGAWVMKRSIRAEERYAVSIPDPADTDDDADGDDGANGKESSPCDPDQCHRAVLAVHLTPQEPVAEPSLGHRHDGQADLRPADIQTPPPRS